MEDKIIISTNGTRYLFLPKQIRERIRYKLLTRLHLKRLEHQIKQYPEHYNNLWKKVDKIIKKNDIKEVGK